MLLNETDSFGYWLQSQIDFQKGETEISEVFKAQVHEKITEFLNQQTFVTLIPFNETIRRICVLPDLSSSKTLK